MTVRLHANESPYDLMSAFKSELNLAIKDFDFNHYPDESYGSLREAISSYIEEPADNIIVTNGSDELIKLLLETYTTENSYVIAPTPSFVSYGFLSRIRGCNFCEIRPTEALLFNEEEYLKQIKTLKPDLVFVCTPNNPTGEKLSEETLKNIITATDKIVAVDEAYIEFSDGSISNWINTYDNLIVLRTLSKAFGLASLRVGYGLASKTILEALNKNRMPYNVSSLSALTAELAIKNIDKETIVTQIKKEKGRVEEALASLPIKVYPSKANFILIKSPFSKKIIKALEDKNIKVRAFENVPLLKEHFRFSIGAPKDNTQIINTMREVLINENI